LKKRSSTKDWKPKDIIRSGRNTGEEAEIGV